MCQYHVHVLFITGLTPLLQPAVLLQLYLGAGCSVVTSTWHFSRQAFAYHTTGSATAAKVRPELSYEAYFKRRVQHGFYLPDPPLHKREL